MSLSSRYRNLGRCLEKVSFLTVPTVSASTTSGKTVITTTNANPKVTHDGFLRDINDMPGPPTLPLLGSLWDFIKPGGMKFNKMFENYQLRADQYGPVYREQLGRMVTVIISDPVEYQKVIHNEPAQPVRAELGPMAHYRRKKNLGLGIVNAQGEEWRKQRSVLNKKMLRPPEIVSYCEIMSDVADDFVADLHPRIDHHGKVDDLKTEIFKWALESVGTFLFDDRIGCYRSEGVPERASDFITSLQGFFSGLQEMLYTVPLYQYVPTPGYRRFEKDYDKIVDIGQYYVDKRASQLSKMSPDQKEGFVAYLLSQKQLSKTEANLSAIDMMTGGVETVSNSLLWSLLILARHPEVQKALVSEIDTKLGPAKRLAKKDIQNLPYLKAFFKEMFRHYPITFSTSRILQNEMEIGGFLVPKGVQVQANLYTIGHDESFFPEPHLVRPERWFHEDSIHQAFSNLVFGHGPRMCIGRRLAEQELRIVLIKILQKYKLSWHHRDAVPEPVLHTVMTPDRPLLVRFTPRGSRVLKYRGWIDMGQDVGTRPGSPGFALETLLQQLPSVEQQS